MEAYLKASASHHVMPSEVAEAVLAIANGEKTAFRNPVGADAEPLLSWRASLSDKDWIATGGIDEDTWAAGMEQGDGCEGTHLKYCHPEAPKPSPISNK